jgi:glycerophosphoryl diester phosphodiesterase
MMNKYLIITVIAMAAGCAERVPFPDFDFEGHRGARGLMPENTLPAFHKALDLGVTTLELDLSVSAENELIVSHEPWFGWEIATHPEGIPVTEENEKQFNLHAMPYAEIARFDVGLKPHPRFPDQQKMAAVKPRFSDMVREIEARIKKEKLKPVWYNIETKSMPAGDGVFHPAPDTFVDLVLKEIRETGIAHKVIVQSFDLRTLVAMHKKAPEIPLALLVESAAELPAALDSLGFTPFIYSPYFGDLTPELVALAKSKSMKVVPWTVNETTDMQRMIAMGVDGLISDYPDRYQGLNVRKNP